ncbi:PREDICTED: barH-like 1 homeobox protein [Gavialis gangeticus]|uniref:barH-like 1 homeobox protein n=1 Tax=Gavialis gangeticus TaxID=94835 RepID=UPI00092EC871|nr:PREDICTED: barH-like 1 homeobox protein [Gavialis gangeticus]
MEGSNGFGIDSILSHRPGSPAVPKGDPLLGDCRSPLELSPRSEVSSGCPSPPSPGRECLEAVAQRQGVAVGLDSHLQPGQVSAPSQSRTVTSSFLIRDILADCKPLAACAPYSSTNGQSGPEPAGRGPAKPGEDFREKMDKSSSNVSSDSEYKGKRRRAPRARLEPPHGRGARGGRRALRAGERDSASPPRPGENEKTPSTCSNLLLKTGAGRSGRGTKWKRQTAVGLELLAEAGNYSALQRMFPSPYFYPQSLVSNLDPGAALYLYRGPSAPPPALQRPLVPRILIHGLQGGSE